MSTAWSWYPSQPATRVLTSIDPNTVAIQPAPPAPLKDVVGNNSTVNPVQDNAPTAAGKVTLVANNTANHSKKRKSDSTDGPNAPADKPGGSIPAKKPRASRTKRSDESPRKQPSKKSQAESLLDVSSVHLDGEDLGHVPVYETCDSIRRKIRDILRKDGVTQAMYCRALAQATPVLSKAPQASQLSRFLGHNGPLSGNTSSVFYASYVLFEKMRIRDRKPKSKFRLEMEQKHGDEGVDIENCMNTQYFTVHETESIWFDKYGEFHVTNTI